MATRRARFCAAAAAADQAHVTIVPMAAAAVAADVARPEKASRRRRRRGSSDVSAHHPPLQPPPLDEDDEQRESAPGVHPPLSYADTWHERVYRVLCARDARAMARGDDIDALRYAPGEDPWNAAHNTPVHLRRPHDAEAAIWRSRTSAFASFGLHAPAFLRVTCTCDVAHGGEEEVRDDSGFAYARERDEHVAAHDDALLPPHVVAALARAGDDDDERAKLFVATARTTTAMAAAGHTSAAASSTLLLPPPLARVRWEGVSRNACWRDLLHLSTCRPALSDAHEQPYLSPHDPAQCWGGAPGCRLPDTDLPRNRLRGMPVWRAARTAAVDVSVPWPPLPPEEETDERGGGDDDADTNGSCDAATTTHDETMSGRVIAVADAAATAAAGGPAHAAAAAADAGTKRKAERRRQQPQRRTGTPRPATLDVCEYVAYGYADEQRAARAWDALTHGAMARAAAAAAAASGAGVASRRGSGDMTAVRAVAEERLHGVSEPLPATMWVRSGGGAEDDGRKLNERVFQPDVYAHCDFPHNFNLSASYSIRVGLGADFQGWYWQDHSGPWRDRDHRKRQRDAARRMRTENDAGVSLRCLLPGAAAVAAAAAKAAPRGKAQPQPQRATLLPAESYVPIPSAAAWRQTLHELRDKFEATRVWDPRTWHLPEFEPPRPHWLLPDPDYDDVPTLSSSSAVAEGEAGSTPLPQDYVYDPTDADGFAFYRALYEHMDSAFDAFDFDTYWALYVDFMRRPWHELVPASATRVAVTTAYVCGGGLTLVLPVRPLQELVLAYVGKPVLACSPMCTAADGNGGECDGCAIARHHEDDSASYWPAPRGGNSRTEMSLWRYRCIPVQLRAGAGAYSEFAPDPSAEHPYRTWAKRAAARDREALRDAEPVPPAAAAAADPITAGADAGAGAAKGDRGDDDAGGRAAAAAADDDDDDGDEKKARRRWWEEDERDLLQALHAAQAQDRLRGIVTNCTVPPDWRDAKDFPTPAAAAALLSGDGDDAAPDDAKKDRDHGTCAVELNQQHAVGAENAPHATAPRAASATVQAPAAVPAVAVSAAAATVAAVGAGAGAGSSGGDDAGWTAVDDGRRTGRRKGRRN